MGNIWTKMTEKNEEEVIEEKPQLRDLTYEQLLKLQKLDPDTVKKKDMKTPLLKHTISSKGLSQQFAIEIRKLSKGTESLKE